MSLTRIMDLPILLYSRIVAQGPISSPAPGSGLSVDTASQFGSQSVDFTVTFIKMIFAMVVVIALALLLIRYVLPRLAFARVKGRGGDIQIEDRLPLDARKSVFLISVEGKRFLIGVSEHYIGKIAELNAEDERKTPTS